MTVSAAPSRRPRRSPSLPIELDRRFEAIVFDWDGTAVPDRRADASALSALVERLSAHALDLIVITGPVAARPRY